MSKIPYSQFPQHNTEFYQPQAPDVYNNITNSSYQQLFQLNRNGLLPRSWSNTGQPTTPCNNTQIHKDSWYQYAPTKDGFNRYIVATGASRNRVMSRNPAGRLFGAPNLLRTNPAVPITAEEPWFNGSGLRTDLANSLGCGPNRPM
jgi:hypothetical protein